MKRTLFFLTLFFVSFDICIAKVYLKRDEALKLAFPEATVIEKANVFLNGEEVNEIETISKVKNKSKLYVFYIGVKDDNILGYAVIDTHVLRTKTETVLYVLNPDGSLNKVEILAFFEPQDYMPSGKWLNLFSGKDLNDTLRVGKDLPNITGATITSNELSNSVRRILAVFQVARRNNKL